MRLALSRESIKSNGLVLGAILGITLIVYWNGLGNPFVPDDLTIIFRNFGGSREWSVEQLWGRNLFGTAADQMELSEQASYFRPLTLLTFGLNYPLARENPAGYRVFNVTLHLLAVLLAFYLLSAIAGKWTAGFAALIFAVHPANVQAVSYISSRSDPLYTIFALLCLLCWHHGSSLKGYRRSALLGLALTAFFLGLFAKENIVVVPAIVLAMEMIWNGFDSWRRQMTQKLRWYLALALLFFVYLYVRMGMGFSLSMESGKELEWSLRVLLAFKLVGLYLALAFYPAHLSLFRVIPIPQSFLEWQVALGFLLFVGILAAIYLARSRHKALCFGLMWFLLSILPLLNLTLLNAPMMEHWLYFPLIGLSLAFVSALRAAAEWVGEARGAAFALLLLALLLAGRTATRNAEWRDHAALFTRDTATYPGNYLAWFWLGHALQRRGDLSDAIRAWRTGLAINPDKRGAWLDLAASLSLVGRDDEAEAAFREAISLQASDPFAYQLLGVHRLSAGKLEGALEALHRSIRLRPSMQSYHSLGSAFARSGQKEKAEEAFQRALALLPDAPQAHAAVHIHLGKVYLRREKRTEALEEWNLALRFDPENQEARSLLAQDARHASKPSR